MPLENLQHIYRRKERLPWQTFREQTIIVEPQKNCSHELDEVASFIWGLADGNNCLAQIITAVSAEFAVDADTAQADVCEFVESLAAKGLLVCKE